MSEGLKEFPPSDLKLERLRSNGILPFSQDLLSFAVFFSLPIVVGVLIALADGALVDWAKKMFSEEAPLEESIELIKSGARLFGKLTLSAAGSIALAVLIVGAIQNRFLFSLSALGISFGRLFSSDGSYFGEFVFRALGALARTVLVLLLFFTGVLLVRGFVFQWESPSPIASQYEAELEIATLRAKSQLSRFSGVFLLAALFVGIVSRLLVVAMFKRRHRMTRAEMEAELREMEAAPEFRNVRRDLLN